MIKFLFFLLVTLALVDPATVRKINTAKAAAEDAYRKGDYLTAVRHYQFLVDSMGVNEDEVVLNLANAFYLAKDTANAFSTYQAVSESPKPDIRSKANQQLGIMANKQGRSEEALNFFKQAIRSEPSNDDARYNYEMLKKKLEEQKKKEEEKKQQNKDQQKNDEQKQEEKQEEQKDQKEKDQQEKDEQNKDQKQKEQEQKEKEQKEQKEKEQKEQEKKEAEQKESEKKEMQNLDREKLEQMKISEEKARMILEAMKNQEKQYLQQQKRKPTQSRDRSKPDW
jgi:Ca-activated chloride channel homolog